jgi:type II secretory pathway component PulF
MIQHETSKPSVNGHNPTSKGKDGGNSQQARYQYLAYSPQREITEGVIKAASPADAEEMLTRAGFHPLVVRRVRQSIWKKELFKSKRVSSQQVLTLTEQMAVLLRAGVPLVSTVDALYQQSENAALKEALETISEDVRGGSPLSEAMGKFPHVFSNFYRQMVLLGETSGDLEGILEQTAAYLGRELALKKTIRRATMYPALVLVLASVTTVVMVKFVLPKILELFYALDVPLPLITRIVLGTGAFVSENQLALGLGFLLTFLALFLGWRQPVTKRIMHRLLLRTPIIKRIIIYRELGRFSRLTALMLHNALPLSTILGMVTGITSNLEIKRVFQTAQANVTAGETLSSGLGQESFIPAVFTNLIQIGEISGNLEGNLNTVADFYDRELDALIESTLALLEPIMTIAVGAVIALVALTIIVPIYSLIGSAGG